MTDDERRQKALALLEEAQSLGPSPVPSWKWWSEEHSARERYLHDIAQTRREIGDFAGARRNFGRLELVWDLLEVAKAEIAAGQAENARQTLEVLERIRLKYRKRSEFIGRFIDLDKFFPSDPAHIKLGELFRVYAEIGDLRQARQTLSELEREMRKASGEGGDFDVLVGLPNFSSPIQNSLIEYNYILGDTHTIQLLLTQAEDLARKLDVDPTPGMTSEERFYRLARLCCRLKMSDASEKFLSQISYAEKRNDVLIDLADLEFERDNLEAVARYVMRVEPVATREARISYFAKRLFSNGRTADAIRIAENSPSEYWRSHILFDEAKAHLERGDIQTGLTMLARFISWVESLPAELGQGRQNNDRNWDLWSLVELFSDLGNDVRAEYFAALISPSWFEHGTWRDRVQNLRSSKALENGDVEAAIRHAHAIPDTGMRRYAFSQIASHQFTQNTDAEALKTLWAIIELAKGVTIAWISAEDGISGELELFRDTLFSRGYVSEWLKMWKTIPAPERREVTLIDAALYLTEYGDPAVANVFRTMVQEQVKLSSEERRKFRREVIRCFANSGRYPEAEQTARAIESREERGWALCLLAGVIGDLSTPDTNPRLRQQIYWMRVRDSSSFRGEPGRRTPPR